VPPAEENPPYRRALDVAAAGTGASTGELQVQAVIDLLTGRAAPAAARTGTAYLGTRNDGTQDAERVPQYARQDEGGGHVPGYKPAGQDDGEGAYEGTRRARRPLRPGPLPRVAQRQPDLRMRPGSLAQAFMTQVGHVTRLCLDYPADTAHP
jgi:hypothetical protein